MKKLLIVLAIIFGVGIVIAAIGGIVYAVNKDKYSDKNFEARTITEENEVLSFDCDFGYGDVTLYPSTDGKLKIDYFEGTRTKYEYSFSNGKATFEQKSKKQFFSFGNNYDSDYYKIAVYLPATLCEELTIDMGSGNLKNECEALNVKKLSLDVASGSVELRSIDATEKIEIDLASGNLKIATAKTAYLKVDAASGHLIFDNIEATTVKTDSASGEIKFNGLTADSVESELATGKLSLSMSGNIEEYRINGQASTGSVTLKNDGQTLVSGKNLNYGVGSKTVTVNLSTGSAEIIFP